MEINTMRRRINDALSIMAAANVIDRGIGLVHWRGLVINEPLEAYI